MTAKSSIGQIVTCRKALGYPRRCVLRSRLVCILLLATAPTCASWASKKSDNLGDWEAHPNACIPDETTCGSAGLPRVTERGWTIKEIDAFVDRAKKGTVAVDHNGSKDRIMENCQLSGAYLEILGSKGSGRMWATNRPLFRTDEVDSDCAAATHVVAAFARKEGRFEAILVPLPCPSVADERPARGCLARGLSGPERMKRSQALVARLEASYEAASQSERQNKIDAAQILEPWVLAPDEYSTTRWLSGLPKDCAFSAHGSWVANVYSGWDDGSGYLRTRIGPKPHPPRFGVGAEALLKCIHRPVFLHCFAGLFEPARFGGACWSPADTTVQR